MNDRELLEMAAKAAGLEVRKNCELVDADDNFTGIQVRDNPRNKFAGRWNPLTDDGQRYRLAKKLDIRIHFGPSYVTYSAGGVSGSVVWPEEAKNDAYAIVQAAAAIGRAMP